MKLINRGNEAELLLEGRITGDNAPDYQELLEGLTKRFDVLILNFNDLKYISSAGLRVLKITFMAMRKKGGDMIITHVNEMIMEVFEMTGFAGVLHIRQE